MCQCFITSMLLYKLILIISFVAGKYEINQMECACHNDSKFDGIDLNVHFL
jgi:hypothetical protein